VCEIQNDENWVRSAARSSLEVKFFIWRDLKRRNDKITRFEKICCRAASRDFAKASHLAKKRTTNNPFFAERKCFFFFF